MATITMNIGGERKSVTVNGTDCKAAVDKAAGNMLKAIEAVSEAKGVLELVGLKQERPISPNSKRPTDKVYAEGNKHKVTVSFKRDIDIQTLPEGKTKADFIRTIATMTEGCVAVRTTQTVNADKLFELAKTDKKLAKFITDNGIVKVEKTTVSETVEVISK
jgi:hypothetical protein